MLFFCLLSFLFSSRSPSYSCLLLVHVAIPVSWKFLGWEKLCMGIVLKLSIERGYKRASKGPSLRVLKKTHSPDQSSVIKTYNKPSFNMN